MKKTIKGLFLAGISLLFTQASLATDGGRTDLEGPGDAEVIAGTGYGHTLFGSADNKCQNCHNDLYDTWKTSMHAKSWKDPIFQSKYQDFLRLQASKIASIHPISGDEYLPGMVDKAGQVCIKCHAPTAFYSNDYEIRKNVIGNMNDEYVPTDFDGDGKPLYENLFEEAKAKQQSNLAPAYNPDNEATVVSLARNGDVYTVGYQIGHKHNREGINCSYCHSIETVRMMNRDDGDEGVYTTVKPMKMGPNGQVVVPPNTELHYNADASNPDMNKFFALIGPEKYADAGDTPKVAADFDHGKAADGRHTMKSVKTCEKDDDDGECEGETGYYTGGPFYGPFGVTGLSNSRTDDLSDRYSLVKPEFQAAVDAEHGDKFESKHQFAAYGKALCLSCHQRSSLAVNPETNGEAGIQSDDQFLELCSTWTAMSDGVGNNFEDTKTSPKCQRCHMEPLTEKDGEAVTVLHQWDQPDKLFTLADNPDLTEHFLPPVDGGVVGPVAEGYLNNHSFMGANTADFGLTKIKTGFESKMSAKMHSRGHGHAHGHDKKGKKGNKLTVNTSILNKTAHMFPGAHPMRRVLTRAVVTDANGNKLSYKKAKGQSRFKSVTNQVAVLEGNSIMEGFETVDVKYKKNSDVVIQGYGPDLSKKGEAVSSQYMDPDTRDWVSPDATVKNSAPTCTKTEDDGSCIGSWVIKGKAQVSKITDIDGTANHFTRIYGRETGKRAPDGTHVVRPGFDSNIASDNRLKPNEKEKYTVEYDTKDAAFPLTATYKVYYLKKGASGVFEGLTADDGFLKDRGDFPESPEGEAAWNAYKMTLKKAAIYEVYSEDEIIE